VQVNSHYIKPYFVERKKKSMTKFEEQHLYRLSDVAKIFADKDVTISMVRFHAASNDIPCEVSPGRQGRINLLSQDDLLTAGVFYELLMEGGHARSAVTRIVKLLPAGVWQDVRDGFTRYAVIQLSGDGGVQLLSDIEELSAPKHPATLVIDLAAIREHVIGRVEDTYDKRRKNQGMK